MGPVPVHFVANAMMTLSNLSRVGCERHSLLEYVVQIAASLSIDILRFVVFANCNKCRQCNGDWLVMHEA